MLNNDRFQINRLIPYISEIDQNLSLTINQAQFDELVQNIQSYEIQWDRFSESLKEITCCGRVVNRSALANPYSILTEVNLSNSPDSIMLLLSALGNFYCFYFYSHTNKAVRPVKLYKRKQNQLLETIVWEDPYISYFPFSEGQIQAIIEIESHINKSFPGFVRFDSDQSEIPIYDIRIGEEFYPKLDLFQVIFTYEPVSF